MPDDNATDPSDEDDPLGDATTEEERLAREAELIEQTDNGPQPEDGEQDPQLED
jgi:hypothetical protein